MPERQFVVDHAVPIRMRDGVTLYADVYRPAATGRYPALLTRTPYNRQNLGMVFGQFDFLRAITAGYAVVAQDTRGRYDSEGEFYVFANDINDGYDTVEWVAVQSWCNGRVGMFGSSYVGVTQWLAAVARPPHLGTIIPNITGSDYHENWCYQGGTLLLGFTLTWTMGLILANLERERMRGKDVAALIEAHTDALDDLRNGIWHLPLDEFPPLLRTDLAKYYLDWLKHPADDDYWRQWRIEDHYLSINVPSFNVAGWYDVFLGGSLQNYIGMRNRGGSEAARKGAKLIVGPWVHGSPLGNISGQINFGARASQAGLDLAGIKLRWLDHWLKGESNGADQDPPVKIFVMGADKWRDEADWPPADVKYLPYYLREAGGLVEAPDGRPLRSPLDTTTAVAWMGYANPALARTVRPILSGLIKEFLR